jgi:hypothetical protein
MENVKLERKRSLAGHRRRLKDIIKLHLKKLGARITSSSG